MTTFASVLEGLLRGDASRPLITFYDHASGERTELSVTTYANWVAKTAGLLADEHALVRGQLIRIDLPRVRSCSSASRPAVLATQLAYVVTDSSVRSPLAWS